jgi:hypothetical protein
MHALAQEFHDGCQGATLEEIEKARVYYVLTRLTDLVEEAPSGDWVSIDGIYDQLLEEGFPTDRQEVNRMMAFLCRKGVIAGLSTAPEEN